MDCGRRAPRRYELRDAIRATMTLHAAQTLQTERRGYGKVVEKRLEARLIELGFTKAKTPNKAKISPPMHYPAYPSGQRGGSRGVPKASRLHMLRQGAMLVSLPGFDQKQGKRTCCIDRKPGDARVNTLKALFAAVSIAAMRAQGPYALRDRCKTAENLADILFDFGR